MLEITCDLICDNLEENYQVRRLGGTKNFPLKPPRLLSPKKAPKNHHIYVTLADYFPSLSIDTDPALELLVICVGHMERRPYIRDNLQVIWIEDGVIWDVFDEVTEVYERYIQWAQKLEKSVETNADLAEMIRISLPIFGNPIAILNKNLYHLAIAYWSSDSLTGEDVWDIQTDTTPLAPERVLSLRRILDWARFQNVPFSPYDGVYSINLQKESKYDGVASLIAQRRPLRQSDHTLFQYFVDQVSGMLNRHPPLAMLQSDSFKAVASDLLRRNPVGESRLSALTAAYGNKGHCFICVKIKRDHDSVSMTAAFVCNSLELLLPGCSAVEYDGSAVLFLDKNFPQFDMEKSHSALLVWLEACGYKAGISEEFDDVREIYYAFRQACCALELGHRLHSDQKIYEFCRYVSYYMMMQSTGEFPYPHILPPGLRALMDYSEETDIDYLDTLRTYLDNMQNATKTARDLYLARSTLLARIERIQSILKMDLNDMMTVIRLRTLICLIDMDCGRDPSMNV